MNKRKWLYAVLACAAAICLLAGYLFFTNRGVKAIDAAAYVKSTTELEAGGKLSVLPDSSAGVPGMKLVADNTELSLYYNPETTEVAVRDKQQGQLWFSNPSGRGEDGIASDYEKEVLSSQITVLFRDVVGTLDTYPNFTRSISSKQFTVESIVNGIRITYTLGDMSLGIDALPKYMSKSRLEEKILSKLDETTAKYVSARYYPRADNAEVYERLDAQISKQLVLNKMLGAFEKAGYTADDLAVDNEENGVGGGNGSSKPNFVIPLEYRLDGGSLLASVPLSQVKESGSYQIRSIELLNFFGAASAEDKGYMLVPDGSGSLIYLNNGKVKEEQYVQKVYGADPNDNSWRRGQVSESARMPIYGMKSGNAAWLAVIEKGEGIASIAADISGKKNSYNNVYSTFALRGEDELELYTGSKIQEIQLLNEEIYKGDIQIRYRFLASDEASYSGMAKAYRDTLTEQQAITPLQAEQNIPFYLDIVGSVDKQKSFLGVPYNSIISMTTFDQAQQITEQLQKDGIDRLLMRYTGWFGKGINHKTPTKLKTDSVLGSRSDLIALSKLLEQAGGSLYPDVAFQQMYHDDAGFTPSSDAARFVTREQAEQYPYNRALNRMNMYWGSYYLLSPTKLPFYVDSFMDRYEPFGIKGIALRDLGSVLSSDYRDSRVVQRDTAVQIVEEQLGKLEVGIGNTMISGANAYAWPYANHLINVPTSSSGFNIADEEVPFYEMVIHGSIEYAGSAMNVDDNQDLNSQLLRSLELGAAPHFVWSYEPSSKLKYTTFDAMFSTQYKDWYDDAILMYEEANSVLSKVSHSRMEEHIRLQEGVTEVKYENGISIIVNYSDKAVTVDGKTVEAQYYLVGGERS